VGGGRVVGKVIRQTDRSSLSVHFLHLPLKLGLHEIIQRVQFCLQCSLVHFAVSSILARIEEGRRAQNIRHAKSADCPVPLHLEAQSCHLLRQLHVFMLKNIPYRCLCYLLSREMSS